MFFLCHSIDLKFLPLHLILKFSFRVEFFDFRISAWFVHSASGSGLLDFLQRLSQLRTGIPLCGSSKGIFSGKI
jgi:hypothetical protein